MNMCICMVLVFFFKQKTAYEMRISDWSSDVCSSDLRPPPSPACAGPRLQGRRGPAHAGDGGGLVARRHHRQCHRAGLLPDRPDRDRKSAVEGKRGSVRVDLGGRRTIKKKKNKKASYTTT